MNKKEKRVGGAKAAETLTKQQMEDRIFNKMLFWLVATAVVEVLMVLINRFYVHIRAGEIGALPAIHAILGVAPVIGIVLCAVFLLWGKKIRKDSDGKKDAILQTILGTAFLVAGCGAFLMRAYGLTAAPAVLTIVPALGILMLIFYLYQKEFFFSATVVGMGIMGLWILRNASRPAAYSGYMIMVLALTLLGVVYAKQMKRNEGKITIGGKEIAILQPGAAYNAYYLTAAVTLVIMFAAMMFGASLAYYGIWVLVAWLFILAVFFTSKMM